MRETAQTTCVFSGDREATLIAYLYEDIEPAARAAFDAHLPACVACRDELAALGGVRAQLSTWSPPLFAVGRSGPAPGLQAPASTWWQAVPVWAQVAAAMLCLGAGAGLANLDVRYGRDGLSVRTGWTDSPQSAVPRPQPVAEAAPWRAEMTAFEQQLRTELRAPAATTPATPVSATNSVNPEVMRRVKAIVDESEKRQQREIALRVAEVLRDVNAQRQADLVKIDRSLGVLQNTTGVEVRRNRQEMLNYLVAASQQRPQ